MTGGEFARPPLSGRLITSQQTANLFIEMFHCRDRTEYGSRFEMG